MKQQKDQHKVGSKLKPRGQEMGRARVPNQPREEKEETPAISGRRKVANKMAADKSAQNIGGDAVTPRTNSPSTPAMNAPTRPGESGGETVFKARLKRKRSK
ncbi:MAG TPA: hypothetical protein VGO73_12155 [Pyrinomonadaceae bacterium]|jgi:hypothetical protein|nr:hypothetical protein [Pyrinomonadaceae bacterium]